VSRPALSSSERCWYTVGIFSSASNSSYKAFQILYPYDSFLEMIWRICTFVSPNLVVYLLPSTRLARAFLCAIALYVYPPAHYYFSLEWCIHVFHFFLPMIKMNSLLISLLLTQCCTSFHKSGSFALSRFISSFALKYSLSLNGA
jgi:hypothetical protein